MISHLNTMVSGCLTFPSPMSGILRLTSKLTHQLPLVGAYSYFVRMSQDLGLEQQQMKMDPAKNEPLVTCSRDLIFTLDYILYTGVEYLLELLDEESFNEKYSTSISIMVIRSYNIIS